jgi:hypothetical protein
MGPNALGWLHSQRQAARFNALGLFVINQMAIPLLYIMKDFSKIHLCGPR